MSIRPTTVIRTTTNAYLGGAVTLLEGSNISFSQTGQNITISSSGGGGVTSLNNPDGTISLSATTGAIDVSVNQTAIFDWQNTHDFRTTVTFHQNVSYVPDDSANYFFDFNWDISGESSRLRFFSSNKGYYSSFEASKIQNDDSIRYILPKGPPSSTGQVISAAAIAGSSPQVIDLAWATAGTGTGDVVGPSSSVSQEMAIFDNNTGKLIAGVTAAPGLVYIGDNSFIDPNNNLLLIGNSTGTYYGNFYGSNNAINGIDIFNSNAGTSKAAQIRARTNASLVTDTYGDFTAYPSNYFDTALASRVVIRSGISQSLVFETDSMFVWREVTSEKMRLDSSGRLGIGVTPTAYLHLKAGSTSIPPVRFTSGSLATGGNILAGNMEFLTDKWYGTISTGPAAKEFTLNDSALTSGRVPFATTNGRLNDSANLAYTSGTGLLVSDNIKLQTAGNGIYVKEGTNATMGTATLSAGTVVVSTTKVTASSRIFLTINGGTLTNVGAVYVSARTAGTSFTITSLNVLDSSAVAWILVEPS